MLIDPLYHPSDRLLEMYLLNQQVEDVALFEEHILICQECQNRASGIEAEIREIRAALQQNINSLGSLPKVIRTLNFPPRQVLLGCAFTAAILIFGRSQLPFPREISTTIDLSTTRGAESEISAANTFLRLVADARSIETSGPYYAEIVERDGSTRWSGPVERSGNGLIISVNQHLEPRNYWVRLWSGDEMLREFALQVR